MDDSRSTGEGDAHRAPYDLRQSIDRRDRATPLGHRSGHFDLGEGLVGASSVRVDDTLAATTREEQDPVALGVFDRHSGEDVGDTGTVGSHTYAELPGGPGVRAGHVGGAGFVAGADQSDSVGFEGGVEAEIGAVDDAKDGVDVFGGEHSTDHFAPFHLEIFLEECESHGSFPV